MSGEWLIVNDKIWNGNLLKKRSHFNQINSIIYRGELRKSTRNHQERQCSGWNVDRTFRHVDLRYFRYTKLLIYIYIYIYIYFPEPCLTYAGSFKMIVGVLTTCHLVLQMQPHVISFYGVTLRIRFMFLLFPQVSWNWRYESEPPLKPSPLTCYKQFEMNSIIMLMFVESQKVHI